MDDELETLEINNSRIWAINMIKQHNISIRFLCYILNVPFTFYTYFSLYNEYQKLEYITISYYFFKKLLKLYKNREFFNIEDYNGYYEEFGITTTINIELWIMKYYQDIVMNCIRYCLNSRRIGLSFLKDNDTWKLEVQYPFNFRKQSIKRIFNSCGNTIKIEYVRIRIMFKYEVFIPDK